MLCVSRKSSDIAGVTFSTDSSPDMSDSDSEDETERYLRRIIEFVRIEKTIEDSSDESSVEESDGKSDGKSPQRSPPVKRRKSRSPESPDTLNRRRSCDVDGNSNGGVLKIKRQISDNGSEEYTVENVAGKADAPRRKPGPLSKTRPDLFRKLKERSADVPREESTENSRTDGTVNAGNSRPDGTVSTGNSSPDGTASAELPPPCASRASRGAFDGDADSSSCKERTRRKNGLPKKAVKIMQSWFDQHRQNPYPTEDEKQSLLVLTRLTSMQINSWFSRARSRFPPSQGSPARVSQPVHGTANGGKTPTAIHQYSPFSITAYLSPSNLSDSQSTVESFKVALTEETDDENYILDPEKILGIFRGENLLSGPSDEMEQSSEENSERKTTDTFRTTECPQRRTSLNETSGDVNCPGRSFPRPVLKKETIPNVDPPEKTKRGRSRSPKKLKSASRSTTEAKQLTTLPKSSSNEKQSSSSEKLKSDPKISSEKKLLTVPSKSSSSEKLISAPKSVSEKTPKSASKITCPKKEEKSEKSSSQSKPKHSSKKTSLLEKSSKPSKDPPKTDSSKPDRTSKSVKMSSPSSHSLKERNQDSVESGGKKTDKVGNDLKPPRPGETGTELKSPSDPPSRTARKPKVFVEPDAKRKKLYDAKPEKLFERDENRKKTSQALKNTSLLNKKSDAVQAATPVRSSTFDVKKYAQPSPKALNKIPLTQEALLVRSQQKSRLSLACAQKISPKSTGKEREHSGKTSLAPAKEAANKIPERPPTKEKSPSPSRFKKPASTESTSIRDRAGNPGKTNASGETSSSETGNIRRKSISGAEVKSENNCGDIPSKKSSKEESSSSETGNIRKKIISGAESRSENNCREIPSKKSSKEESSSIETGNIRRKSISGAESRSDNNCCEMPSKKSSKKESSSSETGNIRRKSISGAESRSENNCREIPSKKSSKEESSSSETGNIRRKSISGAESKSSGTSEDNCASKNITRRSLTSSSADGPGNSSKRAIPTYVSSQSNELFSRPVRSDRGVSSENIPCRTVEALRSHNPLTDLATRRSHPAQPLPNCEGPVYIDWNHSNVPSVVNPDKQSLCKELLTVSRKDLGVNEAMVCEVVKAIRVPIHSEPPALRSSPELSLHHRLSDIELPAIDLSIEVLSDIDIALNPI